MTSHTYGRHWPALRAAILNRDARVCHYCGGHANTVDHQTPKAEGGTDDPDNLVAACGACNSARSLQWNRTHRRFFLTQTRRATSPPDREQNPPMRPPVGVLAAIMSGDAEDRPEAG